MGDFRVKGFCIAVAALAGTACRADAQSLSDVVFPQPGTEAIGTWNTEVTPDAQDDKASMPWASDAVASAVPARPGKGASKLVSAPAGLLRTHGDAKADNPLAGLASYYGQGEKTATGESFDPMGMTAAHRTLPFGTKVKVTRVDTGDSVVVRINDRGPFKPGRVIDLSQGAAENLGITTIGLAAVKLEVMGR